MGADAAATLARAGAPHAMMPLKWQIHPAAAYVLAALVWLWLQWPIVALLPGDEALYVLDAHRLLHGGALYRDIFLAHPPARVWQAAVVLALGAPFAWAKLWAPIAALATAGILVLSLPRTARPSSGVSAAALFLLSSVVLFNGGLFVGVEQALCLAAAATWLALSGRWLLAGLCLAVGSQWALHVGILALPMLAWAHRAGVLRRFAIGLALGLLPLVLELAYFGEPMFTQVFGYHLRKVTAMGPQKVPDRVLPFLIPQAPLLLLAAIGAWRGPPLARRLGVSGLAVLALLLLWPRLQPYYFLLPMPWLVLAAVFGWQAVGVRLPGFAVKALWLVATLASVRNAAGVREANVAAQTEITQLAAQVHVLANGSAIWGDGALVPLLALRTGLPVALGDTDLNAQRFLSGLTPPEPHIQRVLAQKPLIILVPHHGIDAVPALHDRLLRDCDVIASFNAPAANFAGLLLRPR